MVTSCIRRHIIASINFLGRINTGPKGCHRAIFRNWLISHVNTLRKTWLKAWLWRMKWKKYSLLILKSFIWRFSLSVCFMSCGHWIRVRHRDLIISISFTVLLHYLEEKKSDLHGVRFQNTFYSNRCREINTLINYLGVCLSQRCMYL